MVTKHTSSEYKLESILPLIQKHFTIRPSTNRRKNDNIIRVGGRSCRKWILQFHLSFGKTVKHLWKVIRFAKAQCTHKTKSWVICFLSVHLCIMFHYFNKPLSKFKYIFCRFVYIYTEEVMVLSAYKTICFPFKLSTFIYFLEINSNAVCSNV